MANGNGPTGAQVAALTAAVMASAAAIAAQAEAMMKLTEQLASGVMTIKGTVKQS